jgi:hypothetical protein
MKFVKVELSAALLSFVVFAACESDVGERSSAAEAPAALSDCAYATIPDVQSTADCACPRCPHEVGALTRKELDERRRRFRQFCAQWAEQNPCPLAACKQPQRLALTRGQCDTAVR